MSALTLADDICIPLFAGGFCLHTREFQTNSGGFLTH